MARTSNTGGTASGTTAVVLTAFQQRHPDLTIQSVVRDLQRCPTVYIPRTYDQGRYDAENPCECAIA